MHYIYIGWFYRIGNKVSAIFTGSRGQHPMKKIIVLLLAMVVAFVLYLQCSTPSSPAPSPLEQQVTGGWRFSLAYTADSIIYIVMKYDSSHTYEINVTINNTDTMHRETGAWQIISDNISKQDTVWMDRMHCRQINFQTFTLDSIDCGIPRAGIRINISQPEPGKYQWIIPLLDFAKYLPAGLLPPGTYLPPGTFYKE